jgi:tape measure domain-containing protein
MTTLLGDARIRIRPDFTNFEKESKGHISRVGPILATAIKGTIVAAGAGLGAAAVIGVKTAAAMENSRIAFTTMLGSAKKADDFLRKLSKFAATTPFEFPELQTAASSLISVGIKADKVIPIMTTLGNITSGMGTGSEGIKRATVALQQMNAAGKISAEDLNQLRDAGVPVYELLSKATHKSTAEIVKMAQAGDLGKKELDQLMTLLESGKGLERFNGLMEKQGKSLSGLASTFKDTFQIGLANAITPIIPLLKDGLNGAINGLTVLMPKVSTGLTSVVSGITNLYNAVKPAVQAIAPLVQQFAGAWIQNARSSFDALVNAVKPLQAPLAEVGSALGTFARAILPVLIENGRKVAAVVQPAFASIAKVIGEQVLPAIRDFLPAVTPVVKFLLSTFGDVLVGVLKGAVKVIEGVFKIIAGILNVFTGIFTGNWKKVWEGVKQIFGGAVQAIMGAVQIWLFVGLPRLMLKGAGLAFGLFKKAVVAGFNLSKAIFFGAPKFLSDGLLTLGGKLVGLGKNALSWFAREVQKGFNNLVSWIGKVPGRIASGFRSLGKLIVNAGKAGISAVSSWINGTIIDNLNKLTSLFGLTIPHIPGFAGGGTAAFKTGNRNLRAFATGGVMPGYNPGRDDSLIAVGGGEAIMRPEWTRVIGADKVNAMNHAARMGGAKGVQDYLSAHEGFSLGGVFGSVWNGLKNVGGKVVDVVAGLGKSAVSTLAKNILRPLVDGFKNTIGGRAGVLGRLFGGILDSLLTKVENWGTKQETSTGGGGTPGAAGGAKRWTSVILTALRMLGQSASWLPTVLSRMNRESGGDPNAINLWDSNAKAGYPSQGLMQTIPGTFYAYAGALAGRGIRDPLANTYAGLNYAIHRYGSLAALNRPGGYAKGTNNATRGWKWVGERGPELVKFKGGEQVIPNGGGNVNVQVFIGERELTDIVDVRVTHNNNRMADALRRGRR